ncbi:MAG: family 10 glycosylhydrolase [Deltaproteobacteria bacterium]|nr:family 10 glycosylhydrolase [Kofleriaceae bacterium]
MPRLAAPSVLAAVATFWACASPPGDDPGVDAASADVDAAMVEPDAAEPAGEVRGVWITRFAYSTRAGLEAIIDRAAAANMNAVFIQIRGEGDAYYRSTHEPWAKRLTGVLGRDPGWDPLQVAIDRGRMHGMEVHAYFNVLSAWPASQPLTAAEGAVQHPLYAHPEWLAVDSTGQSRDSEYRWFSPGIPAARAHIVATARELLERYDVDGLHLDRIRTSGPDYSRDPVTQAAFDAARAQDPRLTWGDFMRAQVNAMVADLYAVTDEVRPRAKLSAAVWGIYRPLPGCNTSQGYANYYQDSRAWLAAGTMDALVPMIYWPIEPGECTDWAELLDGFMEARAGRHVWAGMHALDDGAWDFAAITSRLEYARTAGAQGTVVFASTYLDQAPARWTDYVGTSSAPGPFAEPAATPRMSWKE